MPRMLRERRGYSLNPLWKRRKEEMESGALFFMVGVTFCLVVALFVAFTISVTPGQREAIDAIETVRALLEATPSKLQ